MNEKRFALSVKVLVRDMNGRYLVIQRSLASKNNGGAWDFPGGKVDAGEDFATALLREVAEETSLTIRLRGLAGSAESELPAAIVIYLIMEADVVEGQVQLSDEHIAHQWVTPGELSTIDLSKQFRQFARGWSPSEREKRDL